MKGFLRSVADYFTSRTTDFSGVTFVMPNRRSAIFLKKFIAEGLKGTAFMPRFIVLSRLTGRTGKLAEGEPREQLMILYRAYEKVLEAKGRREQLRDFDKFVFWGEMLLNDFDTVDRWGVNASKLYANLRNVKEITSDFLDEEQKAIVRELWGDSPLTATISDFWHHVRPLGDKDSVTEKFISLWEITGELYDTFHSDLKKRGLTTEAMRLRSFDIDSISADGNDRYVFVGLNEVSACEARILDRMKRLGIASYFWDIPGDEQAFAPVKRLARHWPMPDDYEPPTKGQTQTETKIITVPSNVAQGKAIGQILSRLTAEGRLDPDNAINTAVVLPDESLLLPTLLALPDEIKAVNITMGIPFTSTAFATLLRAIISMQLRAEHNGSTGKWQFFYEDVNEILTHPHIRLIAAEQADKIQRRITAERLFRVPEDTLTGDHPQLAYIFTALKKDSDVKSVGRYVNNLIDNLHAALTSAPKTRAAAHQEVQYLEYLSGEIERLSQLIDRYGITMSHGTYFTLFERLLNTQIINLNGTPLKGLQIMGVLETRALDFDNVIIASMNEGKFPRKSYVKTMLPNNLRSGYGMPTTDRTDAAYAYYFRRLISRASTVALLYDSRTQGLSAGEPSRYLTQLQYLTDDNGRHTVVDTLVCTLPSSQTGKRRIVIEKTPEIIAQLNAFTTDGGLNLSASALKAYKMCPLKFYLQYVHSMRGDDELTDYMQASDYGTIVHAVFEKLYEPFKGSAITADIIDKIIASPTLNLLIEEQITRQLRLSDASMNTEHRLAAKIIGHLVRSLLAVEKTDYCSPAFRFIAGEFSGDKPEQRRWQVKPGLTVNFKMSIDRIDEITPGHLRFIDYKTGSDKLTVPDVGRLFKRGVHDYDAIFQLLIYCHAYSDIFTADERPAIMPVIHSIKMMSKNRHIDPVKISRQAVTDYRDWADEFLPRLQSFISEIFDPATPFTQAEDEHSCAFCPFLNICARTIPDV